jgi:hypothetical protein
MAGILHRERQRSPSSSPLEISSLTDSDSAVQQEVAEVKRRSPCLAQAQNPRTV